MKSTTERLKGVLSYTEIQAIRAIADEVGEKTSCIITTSKVVENVKITRSVAVSAMKLLEAAGIIEARSLGMKGTYIKVVEKDVLKAVAGIV